MKCRMSIQNAESILAQMDIWRAHPSYDPASPSAQDESWQEFKYSVVIDRAKVQLRAVTQRLQEMTVAQQHFQQHAHMQRMAQLEHCLAQLGNRARQQVFAEQ